MRSNRKNQQPKKILTSGVIDSHFHGAFGIDLVTATQEEQHHLSKKLLEYGVQGYFPTLLSLPESVLIPSIKRLADFIQFQTSLPKKDRGARALGIHLEGPFLSPLKRGAHPLQAICQGSVQKLETLWEESKGCLKIITLAPEVHSELELKEMIQFCKKKKISVQMGHSQATFDQATLAKKAGFQGVTHAWNAMSFHQRDPGILGATLGDKKIYLELIPDLCHVHPQVMNWTLELHPHTSIGFVSDCVPSAGLSPGETAKMGDLQLTFSNGASRLKDSSLAGGGIFLPESFKKFLEWNYQTYKMPLLESVKKYQCFLGKNAKKQFQIKNSDLPPLKIEWSLKNSSTLLYRVFY